jgi:hypothetical protein
MKWEHAAFRVDMHGLHEALNGWGAGGWQLVQVLPWGDGDLFLFFKRELTGDPTR